MKDEKALKLSRDASLAEEKLRAVLKTARKESPTPDSLKRWFMALSDYLLKKNDRDEAALREISARLKWLEGLLRLGDSKEGPGSSGWGHKP